MSGTARNTAQKKNKLSLYTRIVLLLLGILVLFNVLIWLSKGFCDWYVRKIFPLAVNGIGRLTNAVPFNVGDVFMIAVIVLILSAVLLLILSPFFKNRVWRITKLTWKFIVIFVLILGIELSMNWFVLYHTTSIREKEIPEGREYTNVEYIRLYNYVVENINELVNIVARDESGVPYCEIDINEEAKRLVKSMESLYPELGGYYPDIKEMGFSDLFTQRYITGYYFPVTMEANLNSNMVELNDPFTSCHELSHLKGIIREDEANYIGILACISSKDPFFRYSGYVAAYDYLVNEMPEVPDYVEVEIIDSRVFDDDIFIPAKEWERIEENSIIDTETIKEISDVIVDTSLKLNDVEEGIYSYNEVNTLLLHYFLDR